jgi:hypothetical protein
MTSIYGIFDNDTLLYAGSTERNPDDRFAEHKRDLIKGKHCNKTLNKYYDNCNNKEFTYKVIYQVNTDNSLIKFFLEMLAISYLRPKCNKCCIKVGFAQLSLSRCDKDIAKRLIDVIVNA